MVTIIAFYTNKRIANIDISKFKNDEYREYIVKMKNKEVDVIEIFTYIGLLILFGLSNKNEISIEQLWSEKSLIHYSPFALAAMSRNRFQLISRYISFDDIDTRKNRSNNKFHKMEATFKMFKQNLNLIEPSKFLCVDETLYAFRGLCSFRQYIPSKPARYGIKYWCLVDVKLGEYNFNKKSF